MPLQVLLLLTLLGPGSSFQPWDTWEDVAKQAPGHLFARARRQVDPGDDDFDMYDVSYNTDPPEMLGNDDAEAVTPSPNLQAVTGLPGQGDTAGPGTPEPATLGGARGESAGPDAGGATIGDLGTEFVTVGIPITPVFLPQKLVTSIPPIMEASSTQGAPPTELASVSALFMGPAATEAATTQPEATEALTTQPVATEALTTQPVATEAPSTQPATPRDLTTAHPVPSDPPGGTAVAVSTSSGGSIKQQELSQALSPRSPVSSSPAGGLDYIPVKHCLLAILVLALVATTFLVCTVVLAVRLSRKNHMYPVRNYSPTEMVCISALLPEGEEGPAVTANGSLPAAKKPGRREGSGEDREGDDLTLHSFLP
ncbi:P-selectin glycoprotein ligand 1 isoform X3 [Phyllostomus discolor]|uniref:P-selectin glycoprotein ligand 1 isoform X3 n=1 Tax=Phyllostomus discolor TaxID=89673 RepID=A0A7E6CSA3_9CHIR|nr:P-selectin glycoprotein ligand 1 isoform X3 [Phyllostomus discolor]